MLFFALSPVPGPVLLGTLAFGSVLWRIEPSELWVLHSHSFLPLHQEPQALIPSPSPQILPESLLAKSCKLGGWWEEEGETRWAA